jgi:hypothetical protein
VVYKCCFIGPVLPHSLEDTLNMVISTPNLVYFSDLESMKLAVDQVYRKGNRCFLCCPGRAGHGRAANPRSFYFSIFRESGHLLSQVQEFTQRFFQFSGKVDIYYHKFKSSIQNLWVSVINVFQKLSLLFICTFRMYG